MELAAGDLLRRPVELHIRGFFDGFYGVTSPVSVISHGLHDQLSVLLARGGSVYESSSPSPAGVSTTSRSNLKEKPSFPATFDEPEASAQLLMHSGRETGYPGGVGGFGNFASFFKDIFPLTLTALTFGQRRSAVQSFQD